MSVPQLLADLVPTLHLFRGSLVVIRVASFFGIPHYPKHCCRTASTWTADVDFLVRFHQLVTQVRHRRSLNALGNCALLFVHKQWSVSIAQHIGGVDESAQQSRLSRSKRQFIRAFSDDRIWVNRLVVDRFRAPLQLANLHHLAVVQLEASPCIRNFESAVLLLDRVPALSPIGQQFESTQKKIIARTLRGPPSVLAGATPRTTSCTSPCWLTGSSGTRTTVLRRAPELAR